MCNNLQLEALHNALTQEEKDTIVALDAVQKTDSHLKQVIDEEEEEEEANLQRQKVTVEVNEWKKKYDELCKVGQDPFNEPYPFNHPDSDDNVTWMPEVFLSFILSNIL